MRTGREGGRALSTVPTPGPDLQLAGGRAVICVFKLTQRSIVVPPALIQD